MRRILLVALAATACMVETPSTKVGLGRQQVEKEPPCVSIVERLSGENSRATCFDSRHIMVRDGDIVECRCPGSVIQAPVAAPAPAQEPEIVPQPVVVAQPAVDCPVPAAPSANCTINIDSVGPVAPD